MSRLLRYFLLLAVLALPVGTVFGQSFKTHKVKKQETIYGIAHENGLTEEQLRAANPGMESPDFVLKKGYIIRVPLLTTGVNGDVRQRDIRVGVLLPLHNQDNDGRRMLEYYRGYFFFFYFSIIIIFRNWIFFFLFGFLFRFLFFFFFSFII